MLYEERFPTSAKGGGEGKREREREEAGGSPNKDLANFTELYNSDVN